MILAYAYEDAAGSKVPTDEVEEKNGTTAKGECRGRKLVYGHGRAAAGGACASSTARPTAWN